MRKFRNRWGFNRGAGWFLVNTSSKCFSWASIAMVLAWIYITAVLSSSQLTIALLHQLQLWLLIFLQVALTSLPFYRWANIPEIDLAEIPQGNPTGGSSLVEQGGWKQTHRQQKEDIEPAQFFSIFTKTRRLNEHSIKHRKNCKCCPVSLLIVR